MKKILSFLFALFLFGVTPAFAQSSAAQVTPGYNDLTGTNCTTGPCFNPLGTITPGVAGSSAASKVLLSKAGNLLDIYVTSGATQGWLMVFNSTSDPVNGATTAGVASGNMEECVYVPSNTTQSISFQGLPVEKYSVGITAVFSSTGCATKTDSATAFIHGLAQ